MLAHAERAAVVPVVLKPNRATLGNREARRVKRGEKRVARCVAQEKCAASWSSAALKARRMPRSVALTASLLVGGSWPASL